MLPRHVRPGEGKEEYILPNFIDKKTTKLEREAHNAFLIRS